VRPRLTDRVLRGLLKACAKAESEMDADEDQWRELEEVMHARKWVDAMVEQRERRKPPHLSSPPKK
jgi:hypothetical protein